MSIINFNQNIANPFPPISESKNVFTVVKRPLYAYNKATETADIHIPRHVGTFRAVNGKPVNLGVVGDGYKIMPNADLYQTVETALIGQLTATQLDGATVKDEMSYNGAWTKRTWTLPGCGDVMQSIGASTSMIAMQFSLLNSYDGSQSLRLVVGDVDLICTNGMVGLVILNAMKRRHTSGMHVDDVAYAVDEALEKHQEKIRRIQALNMQRLNAEDAERIIAPSFSEQRVRQLLDRFEIESRERGETAWALYSAMTYYASHNSDEFPVRETGNDNVARTLMERQDEVARVIRRPVWQELMAA